MFSEREGRVCMRSVPQSCVTPWTVQAPLSMGFPGQEYQSGLPFPSPGDLPHPGIKPESPMSLALARGSFTTVLPGSQKGQGRSLKNNFFFPNNKGDKAAKSGERESQPPVNFDTRGGV